MRRIFQFSLVFIQQEVITGNQRTYMHIDSYLDLHMHAMDFDI